MREWINIINEGNSWSNLHWFWYNPSANKLAIVDDWTHTAFAFYELGFMPSSFTPEELQSEDFQLDLEDNDVIKMAIENGWVRGRYGHHNDANWETDGRTTKYDLSLQGTKENVWETAKVICTKRRVNDIFIDFGTGGQMESIHLSGKSKNIYLETGKIGKITEAVKLTEGRDAPLYHGTSLYNATKILKNNTIEARSIHDAQLAVPLEKRISDDQSSIVSLRGVSFSRLRTGALNFGAILFVVDQNKIIQNRKLYPVDFWHNSENSRASGKGPNIEAEEFLIGSLTNLNRYLLAIEMSQSTFDKIKNKDEKTRIALGLENLLTHPKLKIINIPKRLDYPLV